jgi:hypothetical protein
MDDILLEEIFQKSIKGPVPDVYRGVVKKTHIQQSWHNKTDFYYMDTGYFGNFVSPGNPSGKKLFHRIVKNDLQKHWLENYPSDRWQEICKIDTRYQWKGWKKKGRKILIVVPNRKSCVFYGYADGKKKDITIESKVPWLMQTIDTIKKHTDMEIVVREKGSRSDRQQHSIFDALDEGIFATVAFNSIAALESVIYGIPSFVTVPCAASPLALTDLSQISKPFYPDESLVQQHCASLAYGQFTGEEIANGTAWKLLKK